MRASLATLAIALAALLACGGTADITDGIVVPPEPVEAPVAAPVGPTPAGAGTAASPHQADCTTTALQLRRSLGQADHVACPARCTAGVVTGTGMYTGDSSVCAAAVHAGALPGAAGGTVVVTIAGPSASFTGTTANGVTSASGTTNHDVTFAVVAAPTTPGAPGTPGTVEPAPAPAAPRGGGQKAGKQKGGKNR